MNAEVKKKWVDALRSGEYRQGEGFLLKGDNYCCLGVLCDLYHKETGEGEWIHQGDNYSRIFSVQGISSNIELPFPVSQWAELPGKNPVVELDDTKALSDLNDSGMGFHFIANVIEEQL